MTKQFNFGCFHENSSTRSYFSKKTLKSLRGKKLSHALDSSTAQHHHHNHNKIENQFLKKKRLYASSDNLTCLGVDSNFPINSLSNSNSAKSLSLTTNNFIFSNTPLAKTFASFNTNTSDSTSSLTHKSSLNMSENSLKLKKPNIGELKKPNLSVHDDTALTSCNKENILSPHMHPCQARDDPSQEPGKLSPANVKSLDTEHNKASELTHSSSVTCSTSSLATSYSSNLFDTSLITTSNVLNESTSSSSPSVLRNKAKSLVDCYLSNSPLSSSSSSVTNISNCSSNTTLTDHKIAHADASLTNVRKRASQSRPVESSCYYYDRKHQSISGSIKVGFSRK